MKKIGLLYGASHLTLLFTSFSSFTATETVKNTTAIVAPPAFVIDCQYHFPANQTQITRPILSNWAEHAAMQAFDFNYDTIDAQLATLKTCFTDQGWQSYQDALKQSKNVIAIKSQHFIVSSHLDGELTIANVKENQWKVSLPMQVVYQNDKQKLTQLLKVDLLIGRKINGDLGIMQLIAMPRDNTHH